MTISREPLGDFGHSILEKYQKIKIDHANLQARYKKAQKRIAKQEVAALKKNRKLPPK